MNRKHGVLIVVVIAALATGMVFAQRGRRFPGGSGGAYDGESLPLAANDAEKRILSTMEQMVQSGEMFLSVPNSDGRMLRLLTEAAGAQTVVEVGTSTGYSGLWFCLALQRTGGKLTTFEVDAERASVARRNFSKAGVDQLVTIVEGDAHQNVTRLKGPIDVVFIDADKPGYPDYLNKLLPLVKPGGLILAHNVGSSPEYVTAVTTNAALETVYYNSSLGITLKKR